MYTLSSSHETNPQRAYRRLAPHFAHSLPPTQAWHAGSPKAKHNSRLRREQERVVDQEEVDNDFAEWLQAVSEG